MNCPYGNLKEGQSIAHCPLGFPGCACADDLVIPDAQWEAFEDALRKLPEDDRPLEF